MNTILIFTASIVFWALWRRVFGGWLSLPRPLIVVIGAAMAAAPFGVPDVTFTHDGIFISWGVISALATVAFWTPGHNFMSDIALLKRYGPIGAAWMAARRWWPSHWLVGSFIDGWTSAAELAAGGMFGALGALIVEVF